jgi:hypothetical protein
MPTNEHPYDIDNYLKENKAQLFLIILYYDNAQWIWNGGAAVKLLNNVLFEGLPIGRNTLKGEYGNASMFISSKDGKVEILSIPIPQLNI